jgi:hypothetical protein
LASSPFSAENGGPILRQHFGPVDRRDFSGAAQFLNRAAVRGLIAASWGDDFSRNDIAARVARLPEPFIATYRHSVFVAHRRRSAQAV